MNAEHTASKSIRADLQPQTLDLTFHSITKQHHLSAQNHLFIFTLCLQGEHSQGTLALYPTAPNYRHLFRATRDPSTNYLTTSSRPQQLMLTTFSHRVHPYQSIPLVISPFASTSSNAGAFAFTTHSSSLALWFRGGISTSWQSDHHKSPQTTTGFCTDTLDSVRCLKGLTPVTPVFWHFRLPDASTILA